MSALLNTMLRPAACRPLPGPWVGGCCDPRMRSIGGHSFCRPLLRRRPLCAARIQGPCALTAGRSWVVGLGVFFCWLWLGASHTLTHSHPFGSPRQSPVALVDRGHSLAFSMPFLLWAPWEAARAPLVLGGADCVGGAAVFFSHRCTGATASSLRCPWCREGTSCPAQTLCL